MKNESSIAPAIYVQPGKGHVSVNPIYGCGVGCPFCVNQADPWRPEGTKRPRQPLASVEQLVDRLAAHKDVWSPLRLSLLDFGEPFSTRRQPILRSLLEQLDERLEGQSTLITTRLHPGPAMLDWLATLTRIRLSLFVSLGDAAGGVRPVTPVEPRLRLLRDAHTRGIHSVMLLKPLVSAWTTDAGLEHLLGRAVGTCAEVVLGGLTTSPEIDRSLTEAGWPAASERDGSGRVDSELRDRVLAIAERVAPKMTLSEHRSCAINRRFSMECRVAGGTLDELLENPPTRNCRCVRATPESACERCVLADDVRESSYSATDAAGCCRLKRVA